MAEKNLSTILNDHTHESLEEDVIESTFPEEIEKLSLLDSTNLSDSQNNVLYFIAGSLAKKFIENFPVIFVKGAYLWNQKPTIPTAQCQISPYQILHPLQQ